MWFLKPSSFNMDMLWHLAIIGYFHNVTYKKIINSISKSVKATTSPILILLFVGALGVGEVSFEDNLKGFMEGEELFEINVN